MGKTNIINVQDAKNTCQINKLIECLPVDKALGHAAKYNVHLKHLEDPHW